MHILITAGPTREYIDDVRFLSNASSGRMGYSLAEAALSAGHEVTLVTGPTHLVPPPGARVRRVESAQQMYEAALACFDDCDGVIATAAVADYRPERRAAGKMHKTGEPLALPLVPTPDIVAELVRRRRGQWIVCFALESDDVVAAAVRKLRRKGADWIVANTPAAMAAADAQVTVLDAEGQSLASWNGPKPQIAAQLVALVAERLACKGR